MPELLVAMVAASVLALTVGAMIWYTTLSWRRLSQAVNMQRDMRVAMDTLTRMTRSATNVSWSTSLVYTARYTNKPPASVSAVGSNLVFDPNTTAGGDNMVLAQGTYQLFSVAISGRTSTVTLRLGSGSDTVSNRVVLYRRN